MSPREDSCPEDTNVTSDQSSIVATDGSQANDQNNGNQKNNGVQNEKQPEKRQLLRTRGKNRPKRQRTGLPQDGPNRDNNTDNRNRNARCSVFHVGGQGRRASQPTQLPAFLKDAAASWEAEVSAQQRHFSSQLEENTKVLREQVNELTSKLHDAEFYRAEADKDKEEIQKDLKAAQDFSYRMIFHWLGAGKTPGTGVVEVHEDRATALEQELATERNSHKGEIAAVRVLVENKNRQVQTLTKELEDLAAKTESEMSVLRQENATLTESVSTSMEAMKQKTELLAVQETKLNEYKSSSETLESARASDRATWDKCREGLEKQLAEAKRATEESQQVAQALISKAEADDVGSVPQDVASEIEHLRVCVGKLLVAGNLDPNKEAIQCATADVADIQAEAGRVSREQARLRTQFVSLRETSQADKARIKELESVGVSVREELQVSQDNHSAEVAKRMELEGRVARADELVAQTNLRVREQQSKVERLEGRLSGTAQVLRVRVAQANAETRTEQRKREEVESKLRVVEQGRAMEQSKIRALQARSTHSQEQNKLLLAKIRGLQEQVTKVQQHIRLEKFKSEELQGRMAGADAAMKKEQRKRQVLKDRVAEADRKIRVEQTRREDAEGQVERAERETNEGKLKAQAAEAKTNCVVCMANTRSVVFTPCMHLVNCRECSADCTTCPVCNASVGSKINVFVA